MRKKDIYKALDAEELLAQQAKQDISKTLRYIFKSRRLEELQLTGELLNDYVLKLPKFTPVDMLEACARTSLTLGYLAHLGVAEYVRGAAEALPLGAILSAGSAAELRVGHFANCTYRISDKFLDYFGAESLHNALLEQAELETQRVALGAKLRKLNLIISRLKA